VAGERILIVDSDARLLKTVAEQVLSPNGFKPLLAQGQDEGIRMTVTEFPHLLLLHLPLDSSALLLRNLARVDRPTPVILMVEPEADHIAVELLRLGVRDYVGHPFAAEDILQAVRRVLGQEAHSQLLDNRFTLAHLCRLSELTETAAAAMEAVGDAVWLVDADLRLVAQNEATSEMLGWSLPEVIGRSVYDLIPSSDGSPHGLCQLLGQAMEERQCVSFAKGVWLATRSNGHILVGGRVVPIVREGQAVGAICAFREVLRERGDKRIRFEFANMTSHLLRTPLSSIQASIDLLLSCSELLDAEEQRTALGRMREQCQRMRSFIRELVEMSRVEVEGGRVYSEPVALSQLIEHVLNMMRDEKSRHVFSFAVTGALPIVVADPSKIELILLNLLRNAVERCPDGANITIELEDRTSEVIISIVDDGKAIPAQQLDKVFWQFYPVDGDGKMPSTYHLGLYTTKRLIELQNGRMWVQSQPGEGSRFSFSLPIWGVS
jgi:two-component system sensor histidine kinase VicK